MLTTVQTERIKIICILISRILDSTEEKKHKILDWNQTNILGIKSGFN